MFVDRMRWRDSDESSKSRLRVDRAPALVVVVVALLLLLFAAFAHAEGSVWWGLTSGLLDPNLHSWMQVVREDYDKSYDVYDAHVCGSEGFACVTEPVPPPECTSGDSCKGAPSPQPEIFGPAPSATFSGAGNIVPTPPSKAVTKSLTPAQKLTRALEVCHRKAKKKRAACEKQAKARYRSERAHRARATRKGSR